MRVLTNRAGSITLATKLRTQYHVVNQVTASPPDISGQFLYRSFDLKGQPMSPLETHFPFKIPFHGETDSDERKQGAPKYHPWSLASFTDAAQGRTRFATIVCDGARMRLLSIPQMHEDKIAGVVQIAAPLAQLDRDIAGLTHALLLILPVIKRQGIPLIVITGKPTSSLATQADVHLDGSISNEACPLGLAPTTSTTVALVLGDALAIALLEARGFTADDFARSHPAGSLGRRLLLHISDVMHTGDEVPRVSPDASLTAALVEMTRKRLGMTAVIDLDQRLLGVFTDGDLRRALDDEGVDLRGATVAELMTRGPKTIGADKLAAEAAQLMEKHQIQALLVVDDEQHVVGALNIHDLLRARVV